jgi:flagellar hook assembly protein FlgD
MDYQEFAAQLVKFSQLEALSSISQTLEEPRQSNLLLSEAISNSALPGILGKTAEAATNKFYFDGENPLSFNYIVKDVAVSAYIIINDLNGKLIRKIELEDFNYSTGRHQYTWNAEDDNLMKLKCGEYHFEIYAIDSLGNKINIETYTIGNIQAIKFKTDGTKFVINNIEVGIDSIIII